MLRESGFDGHTLDVGIQMMFDGEHTVGYQILNDPTTFLSNPSSASSSISADILSPNRVLASSAHAFHLSTSPANSNAGGCQLFGGTAGPFLEVDSEDAEDDDLDGDAVQPSDTSTSKPGKAKTETYPLKPNDLTNAQREMLLEIEWAQRAFMQSYVIAVIDNPFTFENIETLTIARIPNRHLPILHRDDFWDSLPQLAKLSLAVIPDWREVAKLPTSWVQDDKLAPSQSVTGVFQLLQEQISHRKNIKTLRFEWICGGEEAPGLFARNQHILAAPLVLRAMDMLNRYYVPEVLSIPHVEHLSLKNCWISPHILTRLGLISRKQTLQSLTLDSVSLTASLPQNAQPSPVTGHAPQNNAHHAAANNLLLNFQQVPGQNGNQPPGPALPAAAAVTTSNTPAWLQPPRPGSWAHLINTLTPGHTLEEIRYARRSDIDELEPRDPGSITKLEFKSCGYVRLPLDFDQTALDPPLPPAPQANSVSKRISDLDFLMMKPHDYTLGLIVNHMSDVETQTLENAWNMTVGWDFSRSVLRLDSAADGVANAGNGRFDGIVRRP
jgi:hypothetical protein